MRRAWRERGELEKLGRTHGFAAVLEELRRRHPGRSSAPASNTSASSWPATRPGPNGPLTFCPTCKMWVEEGRYGWMAEEVDETETRPRRPIPCRTCTGQEGYEEARRRRIFQRLTDEAKLPPLASGWDLSSFAARARGDREKLLALDAAVAWVNSALPPADEPWRGLYLYGPYGVGKTGLAIAALKARMHRGQPGLYSTLPDLLDRIRRTFDRKAGDGGDSAERLVEQLQDVDVLALDDLGVERPTAWVLEKVFQILDGRMRNDRETIYTSNMDTDALAEHLGQRIVERVKWRTWDCAVGGANLRSTPALEMVRRRVAEGGGGG